MPIDYYIVQGQKKLRCGYTTGSCAAAAAKAAAAKLLLSLTHEQIPLQTPKGVVLHLPVEQVAASENMVTCAVRKDSGDDPDVTNHMRILATVSFDHGNEIIVDGGKGVGRVTRPGLPQPVGEAAINRVPKQMILHAVGEICKKAGYSGGLRVMISVPDGEKVAQKTFNPRLGIEGGISILGTSGIVEPMSERAIIDSIHLEMDMAFQNGAKQLAVTPGNYGENFLKDVLKIPKNRIIQCSNFIGETLDYATQRGFEGLLLAGHAGKFVKLAAGVMNLHSRYADARMEVIVAHAALLGAQTPLLQQLMESATTDQALTLLEEEGLLMAVMQSILKRAEAHVTRRAGEALQIGLILYNHQQGVLAQSSIVAKFLQQLRS